MSQRSWPTTKITLLKRMVDREDRLSWENFVRIYAPLIRHYCCRRGMQETDANDVVQDVLLQISRGIGNFEYNSQRGRFASWLGTITHRAMLKHISKCSRLGVCNADEIQHLLSAMSQQPLGGAWVESFHAQVFREAMERLRLHFDTDTWQAFQQTFTQERSPRVVANELGRTVGWVYQAKSQVLRRLRDEIVHLAEDSVLLNVQSPAR